MNTPKNVEAYIKVTLDYAPKENGEEFDTWCDKYGFRPLGSGRRAWCSNLSAYFRDAAGVAQSPGGDMFLFSDEDIVRPDNITALLTELERQVEGKMQTYPSFSVEDAMHGGNHGDIQAAEGKAAHNTALQEILTIIKELKGV